MSRRSKKHIPMLGGERAIRLTGMEPSLSRDWRNTYGRFRVPGYEAPPVAGRQNPLVVLAEYEQSTAELVSLLAESNGYEVRRATDGREALEMVRVLEPNLLVLSLRLPGIDGLSLIRELRGELDRLVSNVAVLVMDERHGEKVVKESFRSGADDYLELPYEVPVLLRAWRRVTGYLQRPAPLTALTNPDAMIRSVALSHLLDARPGGLEAGLGELLWQPEPTVRAAVRDVLLRLGTEEARAVLARKNRMSDK